MAPVLELIVNPDGDTEYVPPEVPVLLTDCAELTDLQNAVAP
jgi:hypothetical protein